jgi:signal peptidase I
LSIAGIGGGLVWVVYLAVLLLWVVIPIAVAERIGRRKGRRHLWVLGLLGGWIGVAIASFVSEHGRPAPAGELDEPGYGDVVVPAAKRPRDPLGRLFPGLPHGARVVLDWILTIAGAILIVFALKAWVVNPYRIPSSSMEPTLHCARPAPGCEARFSDRVLANRFVYHFRNPRRGEIIVFKTPPEAAQKCGAGGTFVKRLIGLPGDVVSERDGFVYIDGKLLDEPYIKPDRRDHEPPRSFGRVPPDHYFFMGDNRAQSCDSRVWGSVPRKNLIGEVFFVYWPPNRIGFR